MCVCCTRLHLCRAWGGTDALVCAAPPAISPLLAPEIKGKNIFRAEEQQTGVVSQGAGAQGSSWLRTEGELRSAVAGLKIGSVRGG